MFCVNREIFAHLNERIAGLSQEAERISRQVNNFDETVFRLKTSRRERYFLCSLLFIFFKFHLKNTLTNCNYTSLYIRQCIIGCHSSTSGKNNAYKKYLSICRVILELSMASCSCKICYMCILW